MLKKILLVSLFVAAFAPFAQAEIVAVADASSVSSDGSSSSMSVVAPNDNEKGAIGDDDADDDSDAPLGDRDGPPADDAED